MWSRVPTQPSDRTEAAEEHAEIPIDTAPLMEFRRLMKFLDETSIRDIQQFSLKASDRRAQVPQPDLNIEIQGPPVFILDVSKQVRRAKGQPIEVTIPPQSITVKLTSNTHKVETHLETPQLRLSYVLRGFQKYDKFGYVVHLDSCRGPCNATCESEALPVDSLILPPFYTDQKGFKIALEIRLQHGWIDPTEYNYVRQGGSRLIYLNPSVTVITVLPVLLKPDKRAGKGTRVISFQDKRPTFAGAIIWDSRVFGPLNPRDGKPLPAVGTGTSAEILIGQLAPHHLSTLRRTGAIIDPLQAFPTEFAEFLSSLHRAAPR